MRLLKFLLKFIYILIFIYNCCLNNHITNYSERLVYSCFLSYLNFSNRSFLFMPILRETSTPDKIFLRIIDIGKVSSIKHR